MGTWWRRVRGVLGIGTLWAGAAGLVGSLVGGIAGLFAGEFLYFTMIGGLGSAAMGLVFGSGFAAVLSLMERSRTLDELSSKRAAAWGFMVGVAVPLIGNLASLVLVGSSVPVERLIPVLLAGSASYGLVTALLSAGTVALAKREPSSLGPGDGEALLIDQAEDDFMVEGGRVARHYEPASRSVPPRRVMLKQRREAVVEWLRRPLCGAAV
ncbi:MAG: hypothetical protein OEO79_15200 [Gemmatimonadota bacterium]|nr:hypothetical protein [Gemmatimonadota bacterium]